MPNVIDITRLEVIAVGAMQSERLSLYRTLVNAGMRRIRLATTLAHALELASARAPDVLIVGEDAVARAETHSGKQGFTQEVNSPVTVLLVNEPSEKASERALSLGFDGVLYSSLRPEVFAAQIREVCAAREAASIWFVD